MKRAAVALRDLTGKVTGAIGLEGTFLGAGTALLAVGSTYFTPAGPWFVVGAACFLAGLALALPRRA